MKKATCLRLGCCSSQACIGPLTLLTQVEASMKMKCLNEMQIAPMGPPNRSCTLAPLSWQLGGLRVQVFVLSLGSKLPYGRSCGPTWVAVFGTLGPNAFTSGVLDTWESACVGTGTCKSPSAGPIFNVQNFMPPLTHSAQVSLGSRRAWGLQLSTLKPIHAKLMAFTTA